MIDEQVVRIVVDPGMVKLPPEMQALKDNIDARQRSERDAGNQAHWNGATYAVDGLSVQRLGIDESPGVTLRLKSTDYFTFLATQQLDHQLPDGTTVRAKYLDPFRPTQTPDFMCSSFGSYVVVVTADGLAVATRRSEYVGAFPGYWDVSANEALSRSLDSHGRTPPSLYEVARRGLLEELGPDRTEYRLELLAFCIDRATTNGAASSRLSFTTSPPSASPTGSPMALPTSGNIKPSILSHSRPPTLCAISYIRSGAALGPLSGLPPSTSPLFANMAAPASNATLPAHCDPAASHSRVAEGLPEASCDVVRFVEAVASMVYEFVGDHIVLRIRTHYISHVPSLSCPGKRHGETRARRQKRTLTAGSNEQSSRPGAKHS